MPSIAVATLIALPLVARPAHACPCGLEAPDKLLSVGFWGAGGKGGASQGVEGTYSPTSFGPHLSLGVAALEHDAATFDAYGDLGVWALLSIAAGGGYHGAFGRAGELGAGPEAHLFVGLPLPFPVSDDGYLVVEPLVRVTRLFSAVGAETLVQGGLQIRFAGPAPDLLPKPEKRVEAGPKCGS